MSNRIFLTCRHHPTRADSFLLAERETPGVGIELLGGYRPSTLRHSGGVGDYVRAMRKWMKTHRACGGGVDNFTISFEQPKDHDLPKPAALADAIHVGLQAANQDTPG